MRRKQGSKFVSIRLRVHYFQYMLPDLGRDLSGDGKRGLTTASSLVQSLSRDVRNKARNAEANGEEERQDRCVKQAVCSSFSLPAP